MPNACMKITVNQTIILKEVRGINIVSKSRISISSNFIDYKHFLINSFSYNFQKFCFVDSLKSARRFSMYLCTPYIYDIRPKMGVISIIPISYIICLVIICMY